MIKDIIALPTADIYKTLAVKSEPKVSVEDMQKQFDPKQHKVYDTAVRPKKEVKKSSGRKDDKGEPIYDTSYEEVNRVAASFQKVIVNRTTGFILGNGVKLKSYDIDENTKKLAAMVQKVWDDNKLDYFNRKLVRMVLSECEAAELWYLIDATNFWASLWNKLKIAVGATPSYKFRLRTKLLSNSLGDKLYPHFDEYGDMDAFSREYSVIGSDGKKVIRFDIYTAEQIIKLVKTNSWVEESRQANPFKKIPIIYYSQEYPEWYDVQGLIERYETLLSNFADTNDYFGSPMVKVTGKVLGFAAKGEQGKVLQLDKDASAEYLQWDSAPEAVKLEFETLEKLIYSLTQTPNISFENMKDMGDVSGVALKLKFMDAHLKAENKIELFGEMFQRRINLIKSTIGNIIDISLMEASNMLEIDPVFTPYMPKNVKEDVEVLSIATGGKPIMSQRTALENNPLVADVEQELARIEEEAAADTTRQQNEMFGSSNP